MLLLPVVNGANSQLFMSDSIQKKFKQVKKEFFEEKLFLASDKAFYVAGEIIWFKIYCVDANDHCPIDVSKVAYVEILSADNKAILQAKIELKEGLGHGSLQLPFDISTANYTIRAYTAWMKNFDPEMYFHLPVTIVNTMQQPNWAKLESKTGYDFQLLPEGGHLVRNLESKIAFRLVDHYGKGIAANGAVINAQSDTLIQFQSNRFGLGTFLFKPLSGQIYKAVMTTGDGERVLKDFPPIQEKGLAMKMEQNEENTIIKISGNTTSDSIYLVTHCRQLIIFSEAAALDQGYAEFIIPKSKLKEGINHFTILNSNLQPVCERLYFKSPTNNLNIVATTNALVYKKRQKVTIDIETNAGQLPTHANLSIAVRSEDSISGTNRGNILSYLLLTSELKGTIEGPSYYFSNKGPAVDSAIDNLMLVHGWSRFNWENTLKKQQKPIQFLLEYEGQLVSAIVKNKNTGKIAGNIPFYFSVPKENAVLDYA